MKTILYILLAALAILLYFNGKAYWRQLFPDKQSYGVKFNGERNKRRMMMVPGSWKSTDSSRTGQTWRAEDTTFNQDTAFRKYKTIRLNNDRIVYEEDLVERFRKDSPFKELLIFTYYYDSLSPWQVYYHKTNDRAGAVKIKKPDADSILGAWQVVQYIE